MGAWTVERVVHFGPGDIVRDGVSHFGFRDRGGRLYAIAHQRHLLGPVGAGDRLEWTMAPRPVWPDVPNIEAALDFPMFVDTLPDGSLVVSNLGNARLYRVDVRRMAASVLVDGRALGMADMGNAVVDGDGCVWVNEVTGCRVWRFDPGGRPILVLGDGQPGFQREPATFEECRFSWVYDLRLGPDGRLWVLDSRNYALRVIDPRARRVATIAGTGEPGYAGDGGPARAATFGSDPGARFDGPISLAVDGAGNAFIGDRWNHVVRRVDGRTGTITTIAGTPDADPSSANDPGERDPLRLNLPAISSMDLSGDRLFVPTDLSDERGDLAVLRRVPDDGATR